MTTAPFWEEDPWDEEIREREGWYDDLDVEVLCDLQLRTALSRKARAQPRNKKGQFTAKRYVRPRDARGRFIKAPRRIRWAPPATIRVLPSTAAYVADIWQPTQTTTGTWVPVNNYYTITTGTGGTLAATNPVVWDTWRNMQSMTTTYTNGNTQFTVTDEARHNQVYERWHTIAERDRQALIRDEEYEARIAEQRRREDAERQRLYDERQRAREERSRRQLAEMQRLEGAQQRALELLRMILSPEERTYWENTGDIRVRGSDGGMYVIVASGESVHGNIKVTDDHGCTLGSICVAPTMYDRDEDGRAVPLPLADGWVGQYLTLKHNEGEMLRHANWYRQRECQHPGIPVLGHGQAAVA